MDAPADQRPPGPEREGTWFADQRGVDRRLRVSWHPDQRLFVLSLWRHDRCTATFRLRPGDASRLVRTLVDALGAATGTRPRPRRRRGPRRR